MLKNCWPSSEPSVSHSSNIKGHRSPCRLSHSVVSDSLATPWIIAHQAPLSMGFSRQECWNGLSFPPPGDLPDPEIEPASLASPALAGRFFTVIQVDPLHHLDHHNKYNNNEKVQNAVRITRLWHKDREWTVVSRDWEDREVGSYYSKSVELQFCKMVKVLEIGCTTVQIHFTCLK